VGQETTVQAKSRSMLVAVLVTSAIALLNAGTGGRAILLGLLIAGPLLAAASLDAQHTAIIGLYALGLAVLLGIPDGIVRGRSRFVRLCKRPACTVRNLLKPLMPFVNSMATPGRRSKRHRPMPTARLLPAMPLDGQDPPRRTREPGGPGCSAGAGR
jgi:hypothetical protein